MSDMEIDGPHESVDDLRRSLMAEHRRWQGQCNALMKGTSGRTHSELEKLAIGGSMMAANYSYTLAAVLGLCQRLGPTGLALVLSHAADDIMTDGDFENINADLREEPSPS